MKPKVIGIGEVLWDLLPAGRQLGGGPANFAFHANALGAEALVISRIGNDGLGREIRGRFLRAGLSDSYLQTDENSPTGTVAASLSDAGIPHYTIHENAAWDNIEATGEALDAVKNCDAICFGTLAQRTPHGRDTVLRLVSAAPRNAWRVFDVNLRQNFYSHEIIRESLLLSNVVKLNEEELGVISEMFFFGGSAREQVERMAREFCLKLVALTRGAKGSLICKEGCWSEEMNTPVEVVDTIGAGDAFTAALVMGLLDGMDLPLIHSAASQIAGFVCSRAGATPELPQRILCLFHPNASAENSRCGERH